MEAKEGSGYLFAASLVRDNGRSSLRRQGPTNRQEVLNVLVAQLLQDRGLVAAPEQIINRLDLSSRRMPDVLVNFRGLRLAIEGEFRSRGAKDKASMAALGRVQEGIAHLGMALIYPEGLRSVSGGTAKLLESLGKEIVDFAIVTEAEASAQLTLPFATRQQYVVPFDKGNLDALADALRRVYEELAKDRVLSDAVRLLEEGVAGFKLALGPQPVATDRFADALEIRDLPQRKRRNKE